MIRKLLAAVAIAFGVLLLSYSVAAANNGKGKGEGHTPVTICHNVDHNPVTITVDDDSTFEGHKNHLERGKDTFGPCPTPPTTTTPPPTTTTPPDQSCQALGVCPTTTVGVPPTVTVPPTTVTLPPVTPPTVPPTTATEPPTPAPVETSSTVVERPVTLAYTGAQSVVLAGIGFLLVLIGGSLFLLRKRVAV